jgi:hypothetical protein
MRHLSILLSLTIISASLALTQEATKEEQKKEPKKAEHGFALKELTAFHDELHPLVHEALPNGDFDAIRKGTDELLERAMALEKATLPKKFKGRSKEFEKKAGELVQLLQDMSDTKDKVDDATIEKQFNDVHDMFETLAEILK